MITCLILPMIGLVAAGLAGFDTFRWDSDKG